MKVGAKAQWRETPTNPRAVIPASLRGVNAKKHIRDLGRNINKHNRCGSRTFSPGSPPARG